MELLALPLWVISSGTLQLPATVAWIVWGFPRLLWIDVGIFRLIWRGAVQQFKAARNTGLISTCKIAVLLLVHVAIVSTHSTGSIYGVDGAWLLRLYANPVIVAVLCVCACY